MTKRKPMTDILRGNLVPGKVLMREDIAPQDLSEFYRRRKEMVDRMKNHHGRNRDFNPDAKTISYARTVDVTLKRGISRQVDRQIDRLLNKANNRSKLHDRHREINYVYVTHVYTGRYRGHIGINQIKVA